MREDIKVEVVEQLEKDICFGFYNAIDLFETISDMFYDVENFDNTWLKKEIEQRLAKHKVESLSWEKPTDFQKLVSVFDELNMKGIVSLHKAGYTRQDGESDCMEIIEDLIASGIEVKGYCFYHAQDLERAIGMEKVLYLGYDSYNHEDELAIEVAENIVETLKSNGFNIKWNGSLNSRIEILNINWKKSVDNVDYNYSRVFEIMKRNTSVKKPLTENKKTKPFWKFW